MVIPKVCPIKQKNISQVYSYNTIAVHPREQGYILEEEIGFLGDPENFTFTYQMNGETYELYDEQQLLYPQQHKP